MDRDELHHLDREVLHVHGQEQLPVGLRVDPAPVRLDLAADLLVGPELREAHARVGLGALVGDGHGARRVGCPEVAAGHVVDPGHPAHDRVGARLLEPDLDHVALGGRDRDAPHHHLLLEPPDVRPTSFIEAPPNGTSASKSTSRSSSTTTSSRCTAA
ncbi:MAG: hypothetical protein R6X22_05085 [Gemmatimonadota bacterium]